MSCDVGEANAACCRAGRIVVSVVAPGDLVTGLVERVVPFVDDLVEL